MNNFTALLSAVFQAMLDPFRREENRGYDSQPPEKMDTESFEEWFDRQGFENFSGKELAAYFKRNRNHYPPREYWTLFLPTMRIVQKVRTHFGKPLTISSSYRAPDYNKSVGGASRSLHMDFQAADIQVEGVSPSRVYDYIISLRDAGEFKGGVGKYKTFTHIDTRGHNATW